MEERRKDGPGRPCGEEQERRSGEQAGKMGPVRGENSRAVGARQEERVCRYLTQRGYRILERNFASRFGEIDIICERDGTLVFVEVKYRARGQAGEAEAAVGPAKRRRIIRTADYYRVRRQIGEQVPCRFDVAAVSDGEIRYYPNAFDYCGKLL